jgi:hypothetical protein
MENNISMYNLVYVCQFCYQFFDPDFDGGIAFPVRVESPAVRHNVTTHIGCLFLSLILD